MGCDFSFQNGILCTASLGCLQEPALSVVEGGGSYTAGTIGVRRFSALIACTLSRIPDNDVALIPQGDVASASSGLRLLFWAVFTPALQSTRERGAQCSGCGMRA